MKKIINKIKENKGSGYLDVAVLVLLSMMVIALAMNVFSTFIVKDQLNTLANQTLREAQLEGKININYFDIAETIGIQPDNCSWEANTLSSNKVQFGENIKITFSKKVDIGFFRFGSFPINLQGKAIGKSEVYWK